jgi:hypothetical protein
MSLEGKLRQIAREVADANVDRILAFEKEKLELDARQRELQAKLDAANLANDRLVEYEPRTKGDYMCPKCPINSGIAARLKPIDGTDRLDRFRCEVCREVFEFPA